MRFSEWYKQAQKRGVPIKAHFTGRIIIVERPTPEYEAAAKTEHLWELDDYSVRTHSSKAVVLEKNFLPETLR